MGDAFQAPRERRSVRVRPLVDGAVEVGLYAGLVLAYVALLAALVGR